MTPPIEPSTPFGPPYAGLSHSFLFVLLARGPELGPVYFGVVAVARAT
jgi:hypothetical protein